MAAPTRTTYDELPYPSLCHPQTHPDRLATVATLLGLTPPPPDRCRVLELGCASGGNLIPLALAAPASSFIGIDLSAEQIAQGRRTLAALGLTNLDLRHLSILDVDESFGTFDYILCHGVFSWVPRPAQEKVLVICARHLAANGIAFVSYNTYPGWHMRGMIRDMMVYHVSRFPGELPAKQVARARELLEFLVRSVPPANNPYALLLRQQLGLLRRHTDSYLFHEHLEEHNEPLYFLQFCERIAEHGLRYLGEAEFHTMVADTTFPPEVRQELDRLAPRLIEKEQYMDFLRNRTFRQTLVCRDHLRPRYDVRAEQLFGLHVASPLRPRTEALDPRADAEEFTTEAGITLTVTAPIARAALRCLGEAWPRALAFDALCSQARARLGYDSAESDAARQDALALGKALLTAHASNEGIVELWLRPPAFAAEVSERPVASPLARLQAEDSQLVINLRHDGVGLTPFDRHLLPLLDGTRDRAALVTALLDKVQQGVLHISQDDTPITDPERAQAILAEVLDQQLPRLAKAALLTA
jgi:methyltransferase-like protein/cyclopropane fatty-acyl-phospholipid synthase-like methyltransferase